jgi:hypothetical protein
MKKVTVPFLEICFSEVYYKLILISWPKNF